MIDHTPSYNEPRRAAPSDLDSGGGNDRGREDSRPVRPRPGKGIIDIGGGPGTTRKGREDGRPISGGSGVGGAGVPDEGAGNTRQPGDAGKKDNR